MSWIADSESGSSVRGKLNNLVRPVSSGTISSPVEYLDIAIPNTGTSFDIVFDGVKFSADDSMTVLMSKDGGTSFYFDAANYDTYIGPNFIKSATGSFNSDAAATLSEVSGLIFLTSRLSTADISLPLNARLDFNPGDDSTNPSLMLRQANGVGGGGGLQAQFTTGMWTLNPAAITQPVLGRINLLRFMPDGNEDNPPTSGETITAGTWYLYARGG